MTWDAFGNLSEILQEIPLRFLRQYLWNTPGTLTKILLEFFRISFYSKFFNKFCWDCAVKPAKIHPKYDCHSSGYHSRIPPEVFVRFNRKSFWYFSEIPLRFLKISFWKIFWELFWDYRRISRRIPRRFTETSLLYEGLSLISEIIPWEF